MYIIIDLLYTLQPQTHGDLLHILILYSERVRVITDVFLTGLLNTLILLLFCP